MARLDELTAPQNAAATMSMIVQRMTDSEQTLRQIAKSLEVPYGKLSEWVLEDTTRAEMYARASRIWVDGLARETVQIADDTGPTKGEAQVSKLRIDSRLKLASKLDRGTYGDQVAISGKIEDNRLPADRDAMLLEIARGMAFVLKAAMPKRAEPQPAGLLPPAVGPEKEVGGTDQPVDKTPAEDPI